MVTLLLAALAGLMFSACFPTATACSRQAREYKTATAIAERKLEQVRALRYELLTPTILATPPIVDTGSAASSYSFTAVDGVATALTHGTGRLALDVTDDIITVTVTVSWISSSHSVQRSVQLTTYVVDKRTRKAISP
jgi:hypothetical protein